MTATHTSQNRDQWEACIAEHIADELEIPMGDAQGIVEGQPFALAQQWAKGAPAEQAAEVVLIAATPE